MASLLVIAILVQNPIFFFVLSAILWWNVAVPKWNPFELVYNRMVAAPRGKPTLRPAPAPRAFAQGMAAVLMLPTGLALVSGWLIAAYILEALLVIAFGALLFGKFAWEPTFSTSCAGKLHSPTTPFPGRTRTPRF